MGASHLEHLLVLEQAQRCVVVARDLPHSVARERVLKLELKDALCVSVLANFSVKLRASEVQMSRGSNQDAVVGRARDLPRLNLRQADCAGRHQSILRHSKRQLAAQVSAKAPFKHAVLADLPAHLAVVAVASRCLCDHRVAERGPAHDRRLLHSRQMRVCRRQRASAVRKIALDRRPRDALLELKLALDVG